MDTQTGNVGQYYLQVQALTPLEAAQGVSAAEPQPAKNQEIVSDSFLPIIFFVVFIVISLVALLSHRVLKLYGYSRSLGMLIVAFAIMIGGYNIQKQITISSLAGPDNTPQELKISDVTYNSFVIEWKTDVPTSAYLQLLELDSQEAVPLTFQSKVDSALLHRIEVHGLAAETSYHLTVFSSNEPFSEDNLIVTTTAE